MIPSPPPSAVVIVSRQSHSHSLDNSDQLRFARGGFAIDFEVDLIASPGNKGELLARKWPMRAILQRGTIRPDRICFSHCIEPLLGLAVSLACRLAFDNLLFAILVYYTLPNSEGEGGAL